MAAILLRLWFDYQVDIASPGEYDMSWDQIEGNWKRFRIEIQKSLGKLTDDELDQIAGNRTKLIGNIQESFRKTKQEAEEMIDKWGG